MLPHSSNWRSRFERWRSAGEIALFVFAAAVLVGGPNITNVGQVLAWFSDSSEPAIERSPGSPAVTQSRRVMKAGRAVFRPGPDSRVENGSFKTLPVGAAKIEQFHTLMDQGLALYDQGWYGPALARFRQAAALIPSSAYANLWWGKSAAAAGRPAEARERLKRAAALAPGSDVAHKAELLLKELH